MRYRCMIVDDEPLAHKVILEYAKDVPNLAVVAQAHSATEALTYLTKQEVDILFLDIQMPRMTGLEMLRALDHPPVTIITSAFGEYGVQSYEFQICDYLLKPFRFSRFMMAVHKAIQQLGNTQVESDTQDLYLKVDRKLIKVDRSEISHAEAYGNYCKVWVGDVFHLVSKKISDFEPELSQGYFFRIHKSFLINRHHISYIEGNHVVVHSGAQLPISKHKRSDFLAWLGGT